MQFLDPAVTPEPDERLGRVLFEAYLALGEGRAAKGPEALRDAAAPAGVLDSELRAPPGDLAAALGAEPLPEALERQAHRLLARGYLAATAEKKPDERRPFERRVARAIARRSSGAAVSLATALEAEGESAASDLEGLLAGAAEEAIALAGGEGPAPEVSRWLEAMQRLEVDTDTVREALSLAALALGPGPSRAGRVIRLAEGARAPVLLRFVAALPELRRQPEILRGLLQSSATSARACAARALLTMGEEGEEVLGQALASLDSQTRALRAAELYRDLRAAFVARALGRSWSYADAAPLEMFRSALDAPGVVDLLSDLAAALTARAPDVSLRLHETAFSAGLDLIETDSIFLRPPEAMLRSAGALVGAGQSSAVATQLLGAGAQVLSARSGPLAVWAELNLGIARRLRSSQGSAILFYVNLVSIFARAPERLGEFGDAAPLLVRIQRRLHSGHDLAPGASGVLARLERERHLQALAEELARADCPVDAGAARPDAQGEALPAPGVPIVRPFSVAMQAVDGVQVQPPSRRVQTLRVLTGFEILRSFFLWILRWFGYRSSGRIEISRDGLAVEQVSSFLGQTTRKARQEIPPASLVRIQRTESAPRAFLVLGIVALVGLTWFGVSVAFDGFHIGDAVLITGGLGFVVLGLLVDAALYWLFRTARESTTFALFLRDRLRPIRLLVPRGSADRIASALLALRKSTQPEASLQSKST